MEIFQLKTTFLEAMIHHWLKDGTCVEYEKGYKFLRGIIKPLCPKDMYISMSGEKKRKKKTSIVDFNGKKLYGKN